MGINEIDLDYFKKIEFKVVSIEKVEDIEGADNLYKLEINLGKEKRTIVAGIKKHYTKNELKNKKIIIIFNLKPVIIRGIKSQGMLLAAVNEDESKVILISPEKDIEVGSRVR